MTLLTIKKVHIWSQPGAQRHAFSVQDELPGNHHQAFPPTCWVLVLSALCLSISFHLVFFWKADYIHCLKK